MYEYPEALCFAEGERANVVMPGFEGVQEAMAALPYERWRAYGWVTFEYAVHLAVPEREIRLSKDSALLLADTEPELDALQERLMAATQVAARPSTPGRVEIDLNGPEVDLYCKAVAEAIASIRGGRLDKVILSRVVAVQTRIDLAATYLEGRRGNNPARSFLLDLGGWEAAGFSPEIVAGVNSDGRVVTQPLAGTRAFDGIPDQDAARRGELYRDAKEVFEHAISVHYATTELAGICEPGTVTVQDFMSVKERGSVQHLASEVSGRLTTDTTGWDALAVLFPAITASGVPKRDACDLIRGVETERGLYSGAVLMADSDGSLDAALVLRSIFRRSGRTWLRAGAGVVAQSDPERELEETREKLLSVSRFLVPAG
ncbi:salicylate synthase [Micromonospora sp. Llam0]|uniref:salicylate synthase n=1 Tax=Micromonospora sp. Llam0 TaxID=2485143 RepID=UPI001F00DDD7|nr:salicylate synthase [Micromonospora sp. Llam0]